MEKNCKGWKGVAKPVRIICYVILGIIGGAALFWALGTVLTLLWNGVMTALFGVPQITFWQSLGLFLLLRLLIGTFGGDKREGGKDKKNKCEKAEKDGDKYAEWWEKEGKSSFDEYINKLDKPQDKKE